jgi:hypothetical protein
VPKLQHATVVLGVTRGSSVGAVLLYSRLVGSMMSGNARFANPFLPLSVLAADTDALEQSQTQVESRQRGAVPVRDGKLAKVFADLTLLQGFVQMLCDQSPLEAGLIAEAAGMSLKKAGKRSKAPLAASMAPYAPGAVLLVAKAVRKGASYEWQVSTDGVVWTTVGYSTVANITVPNLTPGTRYHFRFRTTFGHETSDWGQPITFMMH